MRIERTAARLRWLWLAAALAATPAWAGGGVLVVRTSDLTIYKQVEQSFASAMGGTVDSVSLTDGVPEVADPEVGHGQTGVGEERAHSGLRPVDAGQAVRGDLDAVADPAGQAGSCRLVPGRQ